MNTSFRKLDDHTLEISEAPIVPVKVSTYTLDDLIAQRDGYIADKLAYSIARDEDIARAEVLIAEAEKLGLIPVPVEVVEEEVPIEE